ncbi:hypothetical protein ACWCQG_33555, partial [Streptomyces sp. NPDC002343]
MTAVRRGHRNVSGRRPGSGREQVRTDGSGVADAAGRVVASEPPVRLATTRAAPGEEDRSSGSPPRSAVRGHRPAGPHQRGARRRGRT